MKTCQALSKIGNHTLTKAILQADTHFASIVIWMVFL